MKFNSYLCYVSAKWYQFGRIPWMRVETFFLIFFFFFFLILKGMVFPWSVFFMFLVPFT